MRILFAVLLSTGISFTSCIDILRPGGKICTTEFRYGVSALVSDADPGEPITNAILTLRDGSYTEVMEPFPTGPGEYAGAGERPGTYTLTIEVPDVATDTISDIEVGFDGCHVIGVALDIRVRPGQIEVSPRDGACTEVFVYGVSAHVKNAVNKQAVTNAVLTLTEGDYTEVMTHVDNGDYVGAGERPGVYTLTVEATGFQTQVIENIEVTRGICHVNTVELDIDLQPVNP